MAVRHFSAAVSRAVGSVAKQLVRRAVAPVSLSKSLESLEERRLFAFSYTVNIESDMTQGSAGNTNTGTLTMTVNQHTGAGVDTVAESRQAIADSIAMADATTRTGGGVETDYSYPNAARFKIAQFSEISGISPPSGFTSSDWLVAFEDGVDNDFNDGFWAARVAVIEGVDDEETKTEDDNGDCPPDGSEISENSGGQTNGVSSNTAAPLSYHDGTVRIAETDFTGGGFGIGWNITRNWSNEATLQGDNTVGNGWMLGSRPFLQQAGDDLKLVVNGRDAKWFEASGGTYTAQFHTTGTLVASGSDLVYRDSSGQTLTFYGFGGAQPGQLKEMTSRGGQTTSLTYTSGQLTEVNRSQIVGLDTLYEKYTYSYLLSGDNTGKVSNVKLERKLNAGSWSTVRQADYSYYNIKNGAGTADDRGGNVGDLKRVVVKDGAGSAITTSYYRYWEHAIDGSGKYTQPANGYVGGLKYVVTGASYNRLFQSAGSEANIDAASDGTIGTYANNYFEYNKDQEATKEIAQGDGCSSCTGGLGTYSYSRTTSAHAKSFNNWAVRTVETLPDGNQNIVYTNGYGKIMLKVFKNTTTSQEWAEYWRYNDEGRVIRHASASAVSGYDDTTYADLVNYNAGTNTATYLNDSAGLIQIYEYASSTTATTSVAGDVKGFLKSVSLQKGDGGDPVLQASMTYIARTDGTTTIYPIASETAYRDTNGAGGQTTSYSYTWHSGTTQMETRTVTHATASAAQNGSGSAVTETAYFDLYGRSIWVVDGDGFITYNKYDQNTGALVEQVVDANPGSISGAPVSGPTRSGSLPTALALTTSIVVDHLGRATKVTDPNGNVTYTVYDDDAFETRTYRGWNATTGTTTGPIEVIRQDRARGYTERLTMSATPATSGSSGSYVPTGSEAISNIQSLTRDVVNDAGQVIYRDVYTTSGLSYSTNVTIGTAGTDYQRIELGYDDRGRQARVKRPDGTWTHTVYDGLGRAVSTWKGTDNTGWTQTDPSNGGAGANNMVKVSENIYDAGGVGDSNLTESRQVFGSGGSDYYATNYTYDFRNRMTDQRGADKVATHYALNNLGQTIGLTTYVDANTNSIVDLDEIRGHSTSWFDERQQRYAASVFEVSPSAPAELSVTSISATNRVATVTVPSHGFVAGDVVLIGGANEADFQGTFEVLTASSGSFTIRVPLLAPSTATGTIWLALHRAGYDRLTSNVWYDARGNQIKTKSPSALFNKTIYDGAGRVIRNAISVDPAEGNTEYSKADDLSSDQVIEQNDYWLDKAGRTRIVTNWKREGIESSATTGPMSGSNSNYHTSVAYWYDAADRVIAQADYGRDGQELNNAGTKYVWNGGSYIDGDSDGIPTIIDGAQNAAPGLSNFTVPTDFDYDWIYTAYSYDAAGRLGMVTDNADRDAVTLYDLAGRKTKWIENYVNGTASETETDTDRTTEWVYDAFGRLKEQKAYNPKGTGNGVEQQTTTYLYASDIDRAWVSYTLYPDSASTYSVNGAGKATISSGTDHITTTFDRLGRTVTNTDQRGVEHTFTYDAAGRLWADRATSFGSSGVVDDRVKRIQYAYDDLSRVQYVTSFDSSTAPTTGTPRPGNALNEVKHTYDGWGNVIKTEQAHDGAVGVGTPAIDYVYVDGASSGEAKYVRLDTVYYPNNNGTTKGTFETWYDDSGDVGKGLVRLLSYRDGNSLELVRYEYVGADMLTSRSYHPQVSGGLMYLEGGAETTGYGAWDRYGRQDRVQWQSDNGTVNIEQRWYLYDRMGNRIAMDYNASGAGTGKNNSDEQYAYDGLNRLVDFKRGVGTTDLDGDTRADVVTTVKFRQQWTLDALGNWRTYQQTNSDTGFLSGTIYPSFTQNRTNNAVNEITGMTGPSWASTGYDSAGNMTAGPKTGAETSTITFRYDAWNRQAIYDANADGDAFDSGDYRYSYDGYGRRITKFQDTTNDATNNAGSTEEFYYNEDYQTVEVRVGSVVSGTKTIDGDAKERYLWDQNYIDAPAMVELDTNTDGTRDYRLWPTFDANYNVTSLVTDQGKVVERYAYTPYGQRLVINGGRNYADSAADPDGVDFSIDTNGSDFGFVGSGFQGLRFDAETGNYYNRARFVNSSLGLFSQRDPLAAKYQDGMNLYSYAGLNPIVFQDPSGMCVTRCLADDVADYDNRANTNCDRWATPGIGGVIGRTIAHAQWKFPGMGINDDATLLSNPNNYRFLLDDYLKTRGLGGAKKCAIPCPCGHYKFMAVVHVYVARLSKDIFGRGEFTRDYHFAVEHSNGSWSDQAGQGGKISKTSVAEESKSGFLYDTIVIGCYCVKGKARNDLDTIHLGALTNPIIPIPPCP